MRRRFSASVVVVISCSKPAPVAPVAPVAIIPPDAAVDAPPPDAAPVVMPLVDHLDPLGSKQYVDGCREYERDRRVHCNPPPPLARAEVPVATIEPVLEVARGPERFRVRIARPDEAVTTMWKARFVAADGTELPDGECKIVDWSYREVECVTDAPLERVTAQVVLKPGAIRVINVQVDGDKVMATIAAGSDGELIPRDAKTARITDASGKPAGSCAIIRVDKRVTICATALSLDDVKQLAHATVP